MTVPAVGTTPRPGGRLDPGLMRTASVLLFGAVMAGLDATIVNVGINAVGRDLHSHLSAAQWVSTGYLLAVSMVMPLSGWASERFGGRRTWMASVALFVAGSLLCGLAWSLPSLVAFRVLQGIGGGMMQPVGQSILVQQAGPSRIGRVMGIASVPVMFAPVVGPVLGGLIVQSLDWRWMFLVNLPVGVLTLCLAARVLPPGVAHARSARGLDLVGLALLPPGLAVLVYGFSSAGESGGFGSPHTLVALGAGAVLLTGYCVHALRTPAPLIDVRLFARRGFTAATGSSFLLGASLYSSMLVVPLYYQQVEHVSVLAAGLLLAPQALGTAVTTFAAGRLSDRVGPRPLVVGGILVSLAGTLAFTQVGTGTPGWLLTCSLLVRGIGMGMTMAPGMAAVYGSVPRSLVTRAASALNSLNRVGGSLGTALLVVVLGNAGPRPDAVAFGTGFWWAFGLTALSLVPAVLFPTRAVLLSSAKDRESR